MTHAAMKDLLPADVQNTMNAALRDFSVRWNLDGDYFRCAVCLRPQLAGYADKTFIHAADCRLKEVSEPHPWQAFLKLLAPVSALSAVEGEAVQWQMRRTSTVTGDWLDWRECEETTYAEIQAGEWANPDVNYESRALYTAPPPQQAAERSSLLELVPEAQKFDDEMEDREWCAGFNSCRRMILRNIERSAIATQPQQAGGAYVCDYCGSDYTDAKYCCQRRREYMNAHGRYDSTPPQPEAGGGEASSYRYFCDGPDGWFYTGTLDMARYLTRIVDPDGEDWTITDTTNPTATASGGEYE